MLRAVCSNLSFLSSRGTIFDSCMNISFFRFRLHTRLFPGSSEGLAGAGSPRQSFLSRIMSALCSWHRSSGPTQVSSCLV